MVDVDMLSDISRRYGNDDISQKIEISYLLYGISEKGSLIKHRPTSLVLQRTILRASLLSISKYSY